MRLRDVWPWLKAEFRWRVLGKRYEVILAEEAQRQLDELPEEAQAEIRKAVERISRNPYTSDRMESEGVTALRSASFELYCEWLKEQGITDQKRAREILGELLELGLVEGDDEVGYTLTEEGVIKAHISHLRTLRAEMNVTRWYIIGIPVCIGLQWVVYQLTSEWFVRCVAGILLFGSLLVVGRYLKREEAEG